MVLICLCPPPFSVRLCHQRPPCALSLAIFVRVVTRRLYKYVPVKDEPRKGVEA